NRAGPGDRRERGTSPGRRRRMNSSDQSRRNRMTQVRSKLLASVAGLVVIGLAGPVSADQLLNGSITSASGQKLDGVQISAKKDGSTITTSVYTDGNGDYFFPA